MESKMEKDKNYIQFQKIFKKGEQVFVGFKHGETSGFIKTINEHVFGLVKIKDSREILYPWDQFNFICTPGFRVNKVGKVVEEKLWELLAKNENPKWKCIIPFEEAVSITEEIETFLADEELYGLTTKDITNINCDRVEFKIDNVIGNLFYKKRKIGLYRKDQKIIRRDTLELQRLDAEELSKDHKSISVYSKRAKETVEAIRNNTFRWEKRVFCGDPWSIEDITKIIDGVFYSLQGCLMTKHKADIWI